MNSTLRAFSSTLSQVSVQMGPSFGMKGSIIAGLCALAMAPSAQAQLRGDVTVGGAGVSVSAPSIIPEQGEPSGASTPSSGPSPLAGITELGNATKNVGRLIGGFLGYQAGRAADVSGLGRLLMTAGGAVGGGMVADALSGRNSQGGGEKASTGQGRELPAEVQVRMKSLVIEAAATRIIATERYTAFERAELSAATQPDNAKAQRAVLEARDGLAEAMNPFRTALSNLTHAVNTAGQQGYAVQDLSKAVSELSLRIGDPAAPDVSFPAVKARVAEIQAGARTITSEDLASQAHYASRTQQASQQRVSAQRP